jgi:RNA polymerase sigma-70 factor (ECF subfamily)
VTRIELLEQLRERILRYAASRIERDQAEDLTQEVMLVLHEKYGHLDQAEDLLPLSLTVLRFKMMAAARKSMRRGEAGMLAIEEAPVPDGNPGPELQAIREEQRRRLVAALQELGERCRELFRWKLAGKSFGEIQGLMGAASINTVYTWDLRCRKELGARLEKGGLPQ